MRPPPPAPPPLCFPCCCVQPSASSNPSPSPPYPAPTPAQPAPPGVWDRGRGAGPDTGRRRVRTTADAMGPSYTPSPAWRQHQLRRAHHKRPQSSRSRDTPPLRLATPTSAANPALSSRSFPYRALGGWPFSRYMALSRHRGHLGFCSPARLAHTYSKEPSPGFRKWGEGVRRRMRLTLRPSRTPAVGKRGGSARAQQRARRGRALSGSDADAGRAARREQRRSVRRWPAFPFTRRGCVSSGLTGGGWRRGGGGAAPQSPRAGCRGLRRGSRGPALRKQRMSALGQGEGSLGLQAPWVCRAGGVGLVTSGCPLTPRCSGTSARGFILVPRAVVKKLSGKGLGPAWLQAFCIWCVEGVGGQVCFSFFCSSHSH